MRILIIAWIIVLLLTSTLPLEAAAPPEGTIQHQAAAMKWKPAPPNLLKTTEVAIHEGDPRQSGLFTMRLRAPGLAARLLTPTLEIHAATAHPTNSKGRSSGSAGEAVTV